MSAEFIHGSANPEQYALLDLRTNTFAIVIGEFEVAQTLAVLFSSRYFLGLCRIDQADNFKDNLIDNEVCTHWGPVEGRVVRPNQFPSYLREDTPCVRQLEEKEQAKDNELFEYLMFALRMVTKFHEDRGEYGSGYFNSLDLVTANVIRLPFNSPRVKLREQLFETIFLELDYQTACNKCLQLVTNYNQYRGKFNF